jgi:hypothetical protein
MMKKITIIILTLVITIFLAFRLFKEVPAVKFLNSLNPDQRATIQMPFDDNSKTKWHFFPGSMIPRAGIQLGDLNVNQKQLLNNLLQSFLSETGYIKTRKIIDLEYILLEITGDTVMRDSEKYFIAFYGNPKSDSLWAWSFEGHHLSLNFTILNDQISIAPRFLGASPATILSGPRKGERTLDQEEDLGLELINSLTNDQKTVAIFQQDAISEIVTFNSVEVTPLNPVGIKFGELNSLQQRIFLKLIDEYLSTIPVEQANIRMENIRKEDMEQVRFGWAGATKAGIGHYYRIQGKSFLIEFDNVQRNANHIHTVWRDFDGDFGRDLIKEHYKNSDHHN